MIVLAGTYVSYAPTISKHILSSAAQKVLVSTENTARTVFAERDPRLAIRASVQIENGSTRVWVKTMTAALLFLEALNRWGSFRQGIDYFLQDTRTVVNAIVERLPTALGVSPGETEFRRNNFGVVGRLHQLFWEVERGRMGAEAAMTRALKILELDDAQNRVEVPHLVDRLMREIEAASARAPRVLPGIQEPDTCFDRARSKSSEQSVRSAPRRRSRRNGVLASRDETGDIRIQEYIRDDS